MKDSILTVMPIRENWQQFCEEPKLTLEELTLWIKIKRAIRFDDHYDDELAEFFFVNNPLPEATGRTSDWSDVVQDADNHRRWVRAHFPLYEQWKAKKLPKQVEMELAVR